MYLGEHYFMCVREWLESALIGHNKILVDKEIMSLR